MPEELGLPIAKWFGGKRWQRRRSPLDCHLQTQVGPVGPESSSALSQQRRGLAQPGAARAVAFGLALDCPLRLRLRTQAGDTPPCVCLQRPLHRERAAGVFVALDCWGSWLAATWGSHLPSLRSVLSPTVTVSTALGFGENPRDTYKGVSVS